MVGEPGIEPGTSYLSDTRSNQLSYSPKKQQRHCNMEKSAQSIVQFLSMNTWGAVLKSSILSFPDFWLLMLVSIVSGFRQLLSPKKGFSYLLAVVCFYGLFVYLIVLFSMGLWSWDSIMKEFNVLPSIFFLLRGASLYAGYFLTKRYLSNNKEYGTLQRKKNIALNFFVEFVCICGSIAGYLVLIFFLILFNSL